MFNPQQLLPIVKGSMPNATDQQVLEALTKFGQKHPNLDNAQALAALQQYMKEKQNPTMGGMARKGKI